MKLAISYGHGGIINGKYQTKGKQYTFTDQDWTVYEGVLNRGIAARLINLCIESGITVYDVVMDKVHTAPVVSSSLEQRDIGLATRTGRANSFGADLYVSIHCNAVGLNSAGPSLSPNGFIVYTSTGRTNSDAIADKIILSMADVQAPVNMSKLTEYTLTIRKDLSDGDLDHEARFYELDKTHMPAVLIECGFFTNLQEARWLSSEEGINQLATAVWVGVGGA